MNRIHRKEIREVCSVREQPRLHFLDRNAKDEVSAPPNSLWQPSREHVSGTLRMDVQIRQDENGFPSRCRMIESRQPDTELPET